eukprot:CAMPEP_0182542066 /NCGR_PEP_ID=MMETSP1323-20130603/29580_1 /TAXON_ID=236787 /ORGANISM="Florenciella parvula, Strain RCC1693" /LENGTH=205 /DNA_ID=CAMNT_0024752883 /DNA_START=61 /DNA_END=678 /DNA_ORIENTATION=+
MLRATIIAMALAPAAAKLGGRTLLFGAGAEVMEEQIEGLAYIDDMSASTCTYIMMAACSADDIEYVGTGCESECGACASYTPWTEYVHPYMGGETIAESHGQCNSESTYSYKHGCSDGKFASLSYMTDDCTGEAFVYYQETDSMCYADCSDYDGACNSGGFCGEESDGEESDEVRRKLSGGSFVADVMGGLKESAVAEILKRTKN